MRSSKQDQRHRLLLLQTLLLTIRVDGGHDVDLKPVEDVPVLIGVLHQLPHDVGAGGWRYPFSGLMS